MSTTILPDAPTTDRTAPDRLEFLSDNAAPSWLPPLPEAARYALPYGDDGSHAALAARFAALFGGPLRVFPVTSGAAANVVALRAATGSPGVIVCHAQAHLAVLEGGAPADCSGNALAGLPAADGKLAPDQVNAALSGRGGGILSLSNATELGAVYTPHEVRALARIAHGHGAFVHMDGARLANALAAGTVAPGAAVRDTGVDVLSFGTAKNGGRLAEAVVVFNRALFDRAGEAWAYAGYRCAKSHLLAQELLAYLDGDTWLKMAARANAAARLLAEQITRRTAFRPCLHSQANMVFLMLSPGQIAGLRAAGYRFNIWEWRDPGAVRLVTNWQTDRDEIDRLVTCLAGLPQHTAAIPRPAQP